MYYVRIGSRTGSPCNYCVHVLATGLRVPHRKVFFFLSMDWWKEPIVPAFVKRETRLH